LGWLWGKCQVLDFQQFANIKQVLVSQRFAYATPNSLIFNALQISLKRLIFNAFTHAKRCGVVGQGWGGVVFGISHFCKAVKFA
jgi:hypothetical protein